MGVPTSQWGNPSDVYSTVPNSSSTTMGDGPILGNYQIYAADGTVIKFVQYVLATAANKAVHLSTAWQNAYQVTPTTAALQPVLGVNDQSGITISANYCGWMTVSGLMFPLCAASTAKEAVVVSSTTNGTLVAYTPGTDIDSSIVNTVVVGGSAAASPCYRYGNL